MATKSADYQELIAVILKSDISWVAGEIEQQFDAFSIDGIDIGYNLDDDEEQINLIMGSLEVVADAFVSISIADKILREEINNRGGTITNNQTVLFDDLYGSTAYHPNNLRELEKIFKEILEANAEYRTDIAQNKMGGP